MTLRFDWRRVYAGEHECWSPRRCQARRTAFGDWGAHVQGRGCAGNAPTLAGAKALAEAAVLEDMRYEARRRVRRRRFRKALLREDAE